MNTYDLVIATPASMLTAAYVRSLTKTIKVLEDNGISWNYVNYESCYIREARERIINDGYEEDLDNQIPFSGNFDYKKIMWIDSDIEWEPEDILSLYHSDRHIITGAYMMTNGKIAVSFDEQDSPYPYQIPTSREVQVSSCGFGFLCIKKGVFEKMPKPWFDSRIFEKNGRLTAGIGEDSSWCIKAGESGFKIWLDPNVRVIHNKTMALAWNK
jgi:hypothetical protein